MPNLEEDDRIVPLLGNLSKRYLGQDYTNNKQVVGAVTADMIDMVRNVTTSNCF